MVSGGLRSNRGSRISSDLREFSIGQHFPYITKSMFTIQYTAKLSPNISSFLLHSALNLHTLYFLNIWLKLFVRYVVLTR